MTEGEPKSTVVGIFTHLTVLNEAPSGINVAEMEVIGL